ncbi:hypothetical protein [Acinetobacter baumannii]|uniref:hypothetical protein n=1 Tax=Acinetobacter baumannii TaxID=470 RepID=UPI0021C072CA|nr:hypothetical protein [Acinetobacter baumannii]MCT9480548.1 hypothetical protein [Acinetobacter baumannii]MCZ3045297.1 hypothetical protein [Acinetobacter baumannii]MDA3472237.1 hypothetical protein [Acinetobacter baumannii]MDA3474589.1 hypothetical protein [Acinetobacter baumannii]HEN9560775.1 hypothetical protein [Acinetobacter baumannii]
MDSTEYFWLTRKKEPKTKPKSWPLPKPTQKYLEAEEEFTETLIMDSRIRVPVLTI